MNGKNNPNLTNYSQQLRREMTKEERHLWYDFLKRLPVTFHRQKVLGYYIVDFYCASAKLVIEIDGSQHFESEGLKSDAIRDDYLNDLGLTIKRYSSAEVNQDFDSVCLDIHNFIFSEDL